MVVPGFPAQEEELHTSCAQSNLTKALAKYITELEGQQRAEQEGYQESSQFRALGIKAYTRGI